MNGRDRRPKVLLDGEGAEYHLFQTARQLVLKLRGYRLTREAWVDAVELVQFAPNAPAARVACLRDRRVVVVGSRIWSTVHPSWGQRREKPGWGTWVLTMVPNADVRFWYTLVPCPDREPEEFDTVRWRVEQLCGELLGIVSLKSGN